MMLQDSITQLEIDIENYEISIKSYNSQVAQLEKERAKVSDNEKLSYTTQIMTTQNSIKRAEYEMKSKQAEWEPEEAYCLCDGDQSDSGYH